VGVLFSRRPSEKRQLFPIPPIPPYPGAAPVSAYFDNTGDRALQVPTVWACVSLLSNTISILPLEVFESAPKQVDLVAKKMLAPRVIREPEPGRTQSEWMHCIMISLLLRGNAYGIKTFDSSAYCTEVTLLHPDLVRVLIDADTGKLTYGVHTPKGDKIYQRDQIFHIRGLTLPGMFEGLSPISYARATIGLDMSARAFASGYFDDSGMPKAVITAERPISQPEAQVVKDRVMSALNGREPLVVGGGVKFTPIQIKPDESMFLETQEADVAQIARYFGVPPEMVGGSGGSSMTYANVEQRSLDFLTFSVQFWLKRIEDAVGTLLPRTQITRFDIANLNREVQPAAPQAGADQDSGLGSYGGNTSRWHEGPSAGDSQTRGSP